MNVEEYGRAKWRLIFDRVPIVGPTEKMFLRHQNRTSGLVTLAEVWSALQFELPRALACDHLYVGLRDAQSKQWSFRALKSCPSSSGSQGIAALIASEVDEAWRSELPLSCRCFRRIGSSTSPTPPSSAIHRTPAPRRLDSG